jgi:arabinogalactan endo-1,4-beta-galactosidase
MKKQFLLLAVCICYCTLLVHAQTPDNKPNEVVVTPYKTTMLANGKDKTAINITVTDKQGDNVADYKNEIQFAFTGDANIISIHGTDTRNKPAEALKGTLLNGRMSLVLEAGKTRSVIKFDVKSGGINKGSVEIHTIQPGVAHPVTSGKPIAGDAKVTDKIIGADISALPQLESRGIKFSNKVGQQEDVLKIMKDNGFNYIRLRIFDNPEQPKGYAGNGEPYNSRRYEIFVRFSLLGYLGRSATPGQTCCLEQSGIRYIKGFGLCIYQKRNAGPKITRHSARYGTNW